ncbi:MAG: sensor histidine kinase, partial [Thermoguttaceae bacterium]
MSLSESIKQIQCDELATLKNVISNTDRLSDMERFRCLMIFSPDSFFENQKRKSVEPNPIRAKSPKIAKIPITPTQNEFNAINAVFEFSKLEAEILQNKQSPFSLLEILEEVRSKVKPRLDERHIVLTIHSSNFQTDRLLGAPCHLRQILLELVNHAISSTEEGSIHIHVQSVFSCGDKMDETLNSPYATVDILVGDTGTGFSHEEMDSLFQLPKTSNITKDRSGGRSGLGIALAERLVSSLGGCFSFKSILGVGSV